MLHPLLIIRNFHFLENIKNIKNISRDIFDIFDILIVSKISWYFPTLGANNLEWPWHTDNRRSMADNMSKTMPFTAMWARLSLFVINSSSAVLSVSRCNSSLGQRSFSYCVPKIRNDVPLSVRQSLSLDSFKRNLKTHYFASNCPPLRWLRIIRPHVQKPEIFNGRHLVVAHWQRRYVPY